MFVKVYTETGTTIRGEVDNAIELVQFLRDLAADGLKCVKWEVERL